MVRFNINYEKSSQSYATFPQPSLTREAPLIPDGDPIPPDPDPNDGYTDADFILTRTTNPDGINAASGETVTVKYNVIDLTDTWEPNTAVNPLVKLDGTIIPLSVDFAVSFNATKPGLVRNCITATFVAPTQGEYNFQLGLQREFDTQKPTNVVSVLTTGPVDPEPPVDPEDPNYGYTIEDFIVRPIGNFPVEVQEGDMVYGTFNVIDLSNTWRYVLGAAYITNEDGSGYTGATVEFMVEPDPQLPGSARNRVSVGFRTQAAGNKTIHLPLERTRDGKTATASIPVIIEAVLPPESTDPLTVKIDKTSYDINEENYLAVIGELTDKSNTWSLDPGKTGIYNLNNVKVQGYYSYNPYPIAGGGGFEIDFMSPVSEPAGAYYVRIYINRGMEFATTSAIVNYSISNPSGELSMTSQSNLEVEIGVGYDLGANVVDETDSWQPDDYRGGIYSTNLSTKLRDFAFTEKLSSSYYVASLHTFGMEPGEYKIICAVFNEYNAAESITDLTLLPDSGGGA